MDDKIYRLFKDVAISLTLVWMLWGAVDLVIEKLQSDETEYAAARKLLEDGHYQQALNSYNKLLKENPVSIYAIRGKALALTHMEKLEDAKAAYDKAISLEPEYGVAYANRGILKDRMGDYKGAIADYEKAIELTPEVKEGPGWLNRFLRNQAEKPPTVASRAEYLRQQLSKPESERLFRIPELDNRQRPYSM